MGDESFKLCEMGGMMVLEATKNVIFMDLMVRHSGDTGTTGTTTNNTTGTSDGFTI